MEDNPNKNLESFTATKLQSVYNLLQTTSPLEMNQRYVEEDQKLFKADEWDYENPELITNQVKEILETVDPASLSAEEKVWREEILWFWHHHAISVAVWKYKDQKAASNFAAKALGYQSSDHPNQITKLLSYLVNDQITEAKEFAVEITEDSEWQTAIDLIESYETQNWFGK